MPIKQSFSHTKISHQHLNFKTYDLYFLPGYKCVRMNLVIFLKLFSTMFLENICSLNAVETAGNTHVFSITFYLLLFIHHFPTCFSYTFLLSSLSYEIQAKVRPDPVGYAQLYLNKKTTWKQCFLRAKGYAEPSQTSRMKLSAKIAVNYFRKKLHLRCLTEFWFEGTSSVDTPIFTWRRKYAWLWEWNILIWTWI